LNVLMNTQTPLPTSQREIRPLNMDSSNFWRLQLIDLTTQSTVCERECSVEVVLCGWESMSQNMYVCCKWWLLMTTIQSSAMHDLTHQTVHNKEIATRFCV
jgi:hypothetical protein